MRTALFGILFVPILFLFSLFLLPKTTFAAWVLSVTSISGNNVTYHLTTPSGVGSVLLLADLPLGDPNREQTIPPGVQSFTMTHPVPSGTYTAEVSYLSTNQSNIVNITLPGAVGALPVIGPGSLECLPGTAKTDAEAVDMENRCRIKYNIYDDKATTFNIIAGLGDGFYKFLTGNSRLYPQTNGVTVGMGALASSGTMVAALYNHPPVSGMDYLASQFNKFNPVSPVYAQAQPGGIGYNALQPVQVIWESFRNIAYVGFVLVFVIIGFMIMFRAHISPQAVATVQDSLPRIVIALFLVTFSYAIAGFMIDAMFLLLNVIITALPGGDKQFVFQKSVFGAIWGSWGAVFGVVNNALESIIKGISNLGFLDKLLGYFGGVIGALVVGIALLFVMFKVFIMLLTSYAYIVILTITAPFFFLAQALPGNNSGQTWFKQMVANVAVFPVVAIMFIFAGILGGITELGGSSTGLIKSGTVGQFPLLSGDIDPNAVGKLIAVGILLMTPGAAELIKNAIGAKGMQGGGGAGAALAAGAAVATAPFRQIGNQIGRSVGPSATARFGTAQRDPGGTTDKLFKRTGGPGDKS